MRTAFLVRHGETAGNAGGGGPEIERSWLPIGLDAAGRAEARRAGARLARLGRLVLLSSDLPRAAQTARIIGPIIGAEPELVPQLRTWNLGDLGGRRRREAEPEVARLARNPGRAPQGGESFEAFRRRVFAALADIFARHAGVPAIVIHARVERLVAAWRAAGARRDHEIDLDVFLRPGEAPGHIERWSVDPGGLVLTHAEAQFHEGSGAGDRCGICRAYGGRDRCTKVRPPMDADDWCAAGVARSDGRWFAGDARLPRR